VGEFLLAVPMQIATLTDIVVVVVAEVEVVIQVAACINNGDHYNLAV